MFKENFHRGGRERAHFVKTCRQKKGLASALADPVAGEIRQPLDSVGGQLPVRLLFIGEWRAHPARAYATVPVSGTWARNRPPLFLGLSFGSIVERSRQLPLGAVDAVVPCPRIVAERM